MAKIRIGRLVLRVSGMTTVQAREFAREVAARTSRALASSRALAGARQNHEIGSVRVALGGARTEHARDPARAAAHIERAVVTAYERRSEPKASSPVAGAARPPNGGGSR